jgi:hypothetical protein
MAALGIVGPLVTQASRRTDCISGQQTCYSEGMAEKSPKPDSGWPFQDPPNVAVFTTTFIVCDGRPILHVSHDADDGAWQFHHGGTYELKDARVVGLGEIVKRDPTVRELADLPLGWSAERVTNRQP